MDRQGQRPRKHRQQAGGASGAILTAAVKLRSEKGNRRFPAGFPLPQGILHGGAASSAAMGIPTPFHRQKQDGGNGCRGAPGGPCSAHATGMGTAGAP
ncbi:hypothetical protein NDU88_002416 [Pleurodeles waltl]|uniref:Uncharacterized protein n=1 Tax=Pleurodeles waltl TaxID=8319 RepID=A0AAV7WLE0_PLEWA|nr:hypothetical protein NDU88_002416 [Pleurodeles waltl]